MSGEGGVAVERVLAALRDRGSRVEERGGSWMAQCPAHDDATASLSLGQGNAGAVLCCQAGCDTLAEILPALKLCASDLFDDPRGSRKSLPYRIVAEYRYTDEHSELLYVKERREPKDFRVRRPDGRGGWIWQLSAGTRRVLYRLPEVIDAVGDGRTVYVVEGEKDADRLVRLGHAATCNFDGAAKDGQRTKWRPEYGDVLRGADVVIIADRDPAGIAHATAVMADLQAKARSVVIRQAAVAREHADVSDHLDAGHGLGNLVPLADEGAAEPWEAPVPLGTRHVLPAFPAESFPKDVAAMVSGVATETQTPPDIAGTIALAALSAAAGGKVLVRVRPGWTEPANIYAAAVAAPGTRKSAVYRALTAPLYAAERGLNADSADARYHAQVERERLTELDAKARQAAVKSGSPEALADAADAARKLAEHQVPEPLQLITSDVSPEECVSIMAAQGGRLAIMSAEGRIFDIITGRYSNGEPSLSPFLEGHAGDALRVNRRGRYEYIDRPAITLGVCIQPSVLAWIARKDRLRGQGMLARFLYAVPADLVGYRESEPPPVTEDVRSRYETTVTTLVRSLADLAEPVTLDLADPARKRLIEYQAQIEPRLRAGGDLYGIRDWAAKLAGATARIAALIHVAARLRDGYQHPVDEDAMTRALAIADYYTAHALAAFGAMATTGPLGLAGDILAWLYPDDIAREKVTQREAHIRFQRRDGRTVTAPEIAEAMRLIEAHGYIRRCPAPPRSAKGGRPAAPVYEVCPAALARQDQQNPESDRRPAETPTDRTAT